MKGNNASGLTLVELLVASAVVSILAALAIPQFAGYKTQAVDAVMKSSLRDGRTAIEGYYVGNGASYEGADSVVLEANGYSPYADVTLVLEAVSIEGYTLRACAEGGSRRSFVYDSSIGDTIGDSRGCGGGADSSIS